MEDLNVKKFLNIFSLIFLLLTISFDCYAVKDFRFVKNIKIIDGIINQLNYSKLKEAHGSNEALYISHKNIIFILNPPNISEVITAAPILNSRKDAIIGEVVTTVKVEDIKRADDVLDCFATEAYSDLKIQLPRASVLNFFDSGTYPV